MCIIGTEIRIVFGPVAHHMDTRPNNWREGPSVVDAEEEAIQHRIIAISNTI